MKEITKSKEIIKTKDDVYKLNICTGHYRPELYLKNYLFTQEILLDVFCSDELVYCYEDYYYNDISIDMIKKYQPHIDSNEFLNLWLDLDEIRIAELYAKFIVEKPTAGLYFYDLIKIYSKNLDYKELVNNFDKMIQENRFIKQDLSEFEVMDKAKYILNMIPDQYSKILPLI